MLRRFIPLLGLVFLLPACFDNSSPADPQIDVQYSSPASHTYSIVYESYPFAWTTAEYMAETAGGHLATFASEKELMTIALNQMGYHGVSCYIGLVQKYGSTEPAGGWMWIGGKKLGRWTAWNGSQPSNDGTGEDYGEMDMSSYRWNDLPDGNYRSCYVLEIE